MREKSMDLVNFLGLTALAMKGNSRIITLREKVKIIINFL